MKKLFERNDLIIIIVISLITILLLIPHFFKSEKLIAEISIDGKTLPETYELNSIRGVKDITLPCSPEITVRMENGRICVLSAECKDKLCQKCGWLDSPGDAAVCLPAKTVISVKGEKNSKSDDEPQAITY